MLDGTAAAGTQRRQCGIWRQLLRCRRGTAAVEFAIGGMAVVTAIIGLVELGSLLFVNSLMEGGLRDAARFGITGFAPDGATREQRIADIVRDRTLGLINLDAADFRTLVYPTFDSVGKPEPYVDDSPANGQYDEGEDFTDVNGNSHWDADMGLAGLGGPGDIVLYSVTYDWPLLTGLLSGVIGQDGRVPLAASLVVRNEPFGSPGNGS